MDIYKYAMQFEKDGEAFYRENAALVGDENLAHILLFLAGEEQNHFRMIKGLLENSPERPKSIFLSDIKNIFVKMKEKNEHFVDQKGTVVAILEKAMRIEDESVKYYDKISKEAPDAKAQALLGMLKRQEQAHYSLLSSLIEYYDAPRLWMEQAEFHNIKEY